MTVIGYIDPVNQTEVIDIDRNFRIVNAFERIDDSGVQVAAGLSLRLLGGFLRQEAFEIIALTLHFCHIALCLHR